MIEDHSNYFLNFLWIWSYYNPLTAWSASPGVIGYRDDPRRMWFFRQGLQSARSRRFRLISIPLCKAKRQYLLTCKVSRYCLKAFHGSIPPSGQRFPDPGIGTLQWRGIKRRTGHTRRVRLMNAARRKARTGQKAPLWRGHCSDTRAKKMMNNRVIRGGDGEERAPLWDAEPVEAFRSPPGSTTCYARSGTRIVSRWRPCHPLPREAARQYLLTFQVSRYCLAALQNATDPGTPGLEHRPGCMCTALSTSCSFSQ